MVTFWRLNTQTPLPTNMNPAEVMLCADYLPEAGAGTR